MRRRWDAVRARAEKVRVVRLRVRSGAHPERQCPRREESLRFHPLP